MRMKIKVAKASLHKDPSPPIDEESEEKEEEEVATHLGGGDSLIGHFTMASNNSSEYIQ